MTTTTSKTGICRHCSKLIRRYNAGVWGARNRDDPHPWYCVASPAAGKHHQPAITVTSPLTLDPEAEQMAREERWT